MSRYFARSKSVIRLACARGAVVALMFAAMATEAAAAAERKPNELERAYTAISLDVESAALCEKISPQAVTRSPFNSPGTRVAFERSRCFFYVALRTLNRHYCESVHQAGSASDGRFFSSRNCAARIATGERWNAHFSFNHKIVLRAAGYTEADLTERFPRQPLEESWMLLYFDLRRHGGGDFQRRLRMLPDFATE